MSQIPNIPSLSLSIFCLSSVWCFRFSLVVLEYSPLFKAPQEDFRKCYRSEEHLAGLAENP